MMSAFLFKWKKEPKPLNEERLGKVKKILSVQLKVEESKINPDSKLIDDLGIDSLSEVELIMALEEEYNIEIPDEDADELLTVRELVEYLEKRIREKQ